MLIDAHAHLDRYEDEALDEVLDEMEAHRILTIASSMDVPSYRRTLEIAERCEWVLPTFGIHPWNALGYALRRRGAWRADTSPLIQDSPMLGEIGMDRHWVDDWDSFRAQRPVLEHFLAAARDQDKVVHLHVAGGEGDVLALLDLYHIRRAVVHWHAGSPDVLREMAARGYLFAIGLDVRTSAFVRDLARELPLDQLLTQTDNPRRGALVDGAPGMPLTLREGIRALAEVKETTPEVIEAAVLRNFWRLTGDDPWLAGYWRRIGLVE